MTRSSVVVAWRVDAPCLGCDGGEHFACEGGAVGGVLGCRGDPHDDLVAVEFFQRDLRVVAHRGSDVLLKELLDVHRRHARAQPCAQVHVGRVA